MSRKLFVPDLSAEDVLFTVADIATQCQVSERTIRRWITDGDLKVVRLGRLVRIRRSDFNKFLKHNS